MAADDSAATKPRVFWQVGLVVADLEASMDELGRALGLDWGRVIERKAAGHDLRFVFSRQGPPYLELIEGLPGSPWDSSLGSRLDHIGYSTGDLPAERERLEAAGIPVVVDGQADGMLFNYHLAPGSNLRLEAIQSSDDEALLARLGLD